MARASEPDGPRLAERFLRRSGEKRRKELLGGSNVTHPGDIALSTLFFGFGWAGSREGGKVLAFSAVGLTGGALLARQTPSAGPLQARRTPAAEPA